MEHQHSARHTPLHEFKPWLTESHWDVATEEKEKRHSVTSAVVQAWGEASYFCLGPHSWVKTVHSGALKLSRSVIMFFLAHLIVPVCWNVPFIVKLCKVSLSSFLLTYIIYTMLTAICSGWICLQQCTLWQIHSQVANTVWHIVSFLITFLWDLT